MTRRPVRNQDKVNQDRASQDKHNQDRGSQGKDNLDRASQGQASHLKHHQRHQQARHRHRVNQVVVSKVPVPLRRPLT